jgi:hypothetical protein
VSRTSLSQTAHIVDVYAKSIDSKKDTAELVALVTPDIPKNAAKKYNATTYHHRIARLRVRLA